MRLTDTIRMILKRPGLFSRVVREEKALMRRFYPAVSASFVDKSAADAVVFTVNGMVDSLGLADRLKGAVTLFQWCCLNNKAFRIFWSQPFDLRQYLVPAEYDWNLDAADMVYSSKVARPMMFIGVSEPLFLERLHRAKQLHCFANRQLLVDAKFDWSDSFHRLFRPSPRLADIINDVKSSLADKYRRFITSHPDAASSPCYIALVFRFQNLLGDFKEADYAPLTEHDSATLMSQCHTALEHVRRMHPHSFFLVCSDSLTFMNSVSQADDIFVVPGRVVHISYTENESFDVYAKSFVDLYMIAGATCVYNIVCGKMYPSGFPQTAAQIGKIPFSRLTF